MLYIYLPVLWAVFVSTINWDQKKFYAKLTTLVISVINLIISLYYKFNSNFFKISSYMVKYLQIDNFGVLPPLPHQFVTKPLQSSLTADLTEVVTKVNELMPQLSEFILQFNNVVASNSISVITEANGNMSLDVPVTMPDDHAEQLSRRIGIIDRLITTRGQEISGLLHKGLEIEGKLKQQDPQFTSQILEKINEFNRLNDGYKH